MQIISVWPKQGWYRFLIRCAGESKESCLRCYKGKCISWLPTDTDCMLFELKCPPKSIGVIMYLIWLIFNRKSFCSNKVLSSRKRAEKRAESKVKSDEIIQKVMWTCKGDTEVGGQCGWDWGQYPGLEHSVGMKHFFEFYWSGFWLSVPVTCFVTDSFPSWKRVVFH